MKYVVTNVGFIGEEFEGQLHEVLIEEQNGKIVVIGNRPMGSSAPWDTDHEIWLGDLLDKITDRSVQERCIHEVIQDLQQDIEKWTGKWEHITYLRKQALHEIKQRFGVN